MPGRDLDLLCEAARAAGAIARRFFTAGNAETWDKPDDAGPVTEADLAVNGMLSSELRGARPDYGWLSEETEDGASRLADERVFIIDPIDGTRSFIAGENAWAHSLAIVEKGEVVAGAVFLPMLDKLYAAERGGGATLNGAPITVTGQGDLSAATVLSAKPNFAPHHWQGGTPPEVQRAYRPSLAYRLCLVAEGRFDAMLTLRPTWEWDIAAGDLILREAGAVTGDRKGRDLRFNNRLPQVDGVVAGNPALHEALTEALA
ncbi:inositol monophosphatase family protein [Roseovarius sp. C7]|uniref:inositol monophosphatase family protein n=1 Tax=Roseovarius sp. C7 TaxID=3398643 RepID=UPI0039F733A9